MTTTTQITDMGDRISVQVLGSGPVPLARRTIHRVEGGYEYIYCSPEGPHANVRKVLPTREAAVAEILADFNRDNG